MPLMKRVNSKGHQANVGGSGPGGTVEADFELVFQHFQTLNNQIEQKTRQVFDSVNRFNDPVDKAGDDASPRPTSTKSQTGRPKSAAAVDKKKDQQLIVELHQRLQAAKHDYECLSRKHKLLEEEKQRQELELIDSEENAKKLKGQLAARHRQSETHKKDMALTVEKLKLEEQTRRNLQKDLEALSKQLTTVMSEKDKLEEKLERCKMDNEVIKKYKVCDSSNSRFPLMMRCIRKQATLIDNLMEQIAILEQHGAVSDKKEPRDVGLSHRKKIRSGSLVGLS